MTILGARVVLVLRAQAAYSGPANPHSPPPTRLLPASMVAVFGKRQRRRTLEELAR